MKNITRFLVFLSATLHLTILSGQSIFLEEGFENGPPAGWTMDTLWKHGNSEQLSNRETWDNYYIPEHGHFVGLNDESSSADFFSEALLISPKIGLQRADQPLLLTFDAFFPNLDLAADEKASVLISTDAENWSRAYTLDEFSNEPNNWKEHGVLLDEAYNGKDIYIAFQYSDGGSRNTGLCIDNVRLSTAPERRLYTTIRPLHRYSRVSPRQYEPFRWEISVSNAGTQALENISMRKSLIMDGASTYNIVHTLPAIPSGGTFRDTVSFSTPQFARYRNFIILRDEATDSTLLLESSEFYFSESVLAQDDNKKDIALGFGFSNPRWYGYYGTSFSFQQPDTLVGISIYVVNDPDSLYADRGPASTKTFNLSINTIDENGQPADEHYHSAAILAGDDSQGWVYHELPEPMPLSSSQQYLFSAGQDSHQGILGFGFDEQAGHQKFWIYSPVARGGIPWENDIRHRYQLMIRPHLKAAGTLTSTVEASLPEADKFRLWPNPSSHQINVEFRAPIEATAFISIIGLDGRAWQEKQLPTAGRQTLNLKKLPAGLYFLQARFENGDIQVKKLMKNR